MLFFFVITINKSTALPVKIEVNDVYAFIPIGIFFYLLQFQDGA